MSTIATSGSEGWKKGSVYFLSHGGPPTMFDPDSKPYRAWREYGRRVGESPPRGLVVVSAHWENTEAAGVLINTDSMNPLVYDFHGFPDHFYRQTFESRGDTEMVKDVKDALERCGIEVTEAKRGLDHGIWVPFKVAFDGKTDIPIVQVSLPGQRGQLGSTADLGTALASLRDVISYGAIIGAVDRIRDQGYGIMGTGQATHNLRDLFQNRPTGYIKPFMDAIQSALTSPDPLSGTVDLFRHPLYRSAHPSPEHFLPLVVAAAAIEKGDKMETIFAAEDNKVGWGMWMWTPE